MAKIIQLQKTKKENVINVCISEITGKNKAIFDCPLSALCDIVKLNID